MSDQGERSVRWTEMSEDVPDGGQEPGAAEAAPPRMTFPEAKVPEVPLPAPEGRTDFSGEEPHDVWGKVETPGAAEPGAQPAAQPGEEDRLPEADDVKVAPVPDESDPYATPAASGEAEAPLADPYEVGETPDEGRLPVAGSPVVRGETELPPGGGVPGAQAWEGSLFDGGAGGEGDGKYAPVEQAGPATPPKPGKPSSGNWRMPEWMDDEESADAKLGGRDPRDPRDPGVPAPPKRADGDSLDDDGGRSRLVLFGGVGLLVVAVIAAGGVYLMKNKDDSAPAASEGKQNRPVAPNQPPPQEQPKVQLPPDKPFKHFAGKPSKVLGRVADPHSGLSYPRLGAPWQVPTKKNKLGIAGWSGQQILVTEKHGARLWYGQALTGTLIPTLQSAYKGPASLKTVTALAANGLEANYYGFPHRKTPYSSSELNVGGHKGWLIVSYLGYKRAGVKATGEVVATAVIDTGRKTPAVAFVSLPNTHRKMWPDVTQFVQQLKVGG